MAFLVLFTKFLSRCPTPALSQVLVACLLSINSEVAQSVFGASYSVSFQCWSLCKISNASQLSFGTVVWFLWPLTLGKTLSSLYNMRSVPPQLLTLHTCSCSLVPCGAHVVSPAEPFGQAHHKRCGTTLFWGRHFCPWKWTSKDLWWKVYDYLLNFMNILVFTYHSQTVVVEHRSLTKNPILVTVPI